MSIVLLLYEMLMWGAGNAEYCDTDFVLRLSNILKISLITILQKPVSQSNARLKAIGPSLVVIKTKIRVSRVIPRRSSSTCPRRMVWCSQYRTSTFPTRFHLTAWALEQIFQCLTAFWACRTTLYFWPTAVVEAG